MAAVRRDTVAVDDTQGHAFDDGRPGTGPYDVDAIDPEATDAGGLVDFGAIRLPVPPRGTVALEPGEGGRMQAVHVSLPEGRLSVSALAAPKSSALWPELAKEINASLRDGGARVRSFSGEWGRELHATTGAATSVFVGVDGPRWMLYGVATGPTRDAGALDTELRRMLRGVVVVRGKSPYPVRTVLPLATPEYLAALEAAEKAPHTTAITVQKPAAAAPTTALPVQQRSAAATGAHPVEPAAPLTTALPTTAPATTALPTTAPATTALPVQPAARAPQPVEPVAPATTALPVQQPVQQPMQADPPAPPTTALPVQQPVPPRPRPTGAPETVAVPFNRGPRFPAPSETRAMRPPAVPAARNGAAPGPQGPAPNGAPPAVGGPRVPMNPPRGTGPVPPPLRPAAGPPPVAPGPRGLAEPPIGPADFGSAVPPVRPAGEPARGVAASTEFGPRGLPATSTGSIPVVPPLPPAAEQRSGAIPAASRPAPGVPDELEIPSWDTPMWADPVQRISDVDDSPLLNLGIDPDDILPLDATPARDPLAAGPLVAEPFGTGAWPVSASPGLAPAEATAPPAEISLADTPIAAALSGETATEPQSVVATGSGHRALDPETPWDDVPASGRRALREPEPEVAAQPTGRRALRDPQPEEPTGRRARREPEPLPESLPEPEPVRPTGRRALREPVPTEPWALGSLPDEPTEPTESTEPTEPAVARSGRHLAVRPAAEQASPGRHGSPDEVPVSRSGRQDVVPAAALLAESAVTRTGRRRARAEEPETPVEAAAEPTVSRSGRHLDDVPPADEPTVERPGRRRRAETRLADAAPFAAAPTTADAAPDSGLLGSDLFGPVVVDEPATAEEPPRRGRRYAESAADAPSVFALAERLATEPSRRARRRAAEEPPPAPPEPVVPEPEAWPLSRVDASYEMIPVEVNPVRIYVPPVAPESTWRKDPGLSGFALFDADPNEPRPNRFGRSDETGPSPVYTPLLVRLGPRNAELPTGDWPMVEPAREYPWTRKFAGNGAADTGTSSVLTGERAPASPWDDLAPTEPVGDFAGRGRHYRPDLG